MRQEERLQRCTLAAGLCSLVTIVLLETGDHSFAAPLAAPAAACRRARLGCVLRDGCGLACAVDARLKALGFGAQARRASRGRWCAC
jgi:hypothetical protein